MNPLTRMYRRSHPFRVLLYLLLVPFWALLQFVCADSLSGYSHAGNVILVLLIMLFAGWAWWYGEDRDRRAAARAARDGTLSNGDSPGTNGHAPRTDGA